MLDVGLFFFVQVYGHRLCLSNVSVHKPTLKTCLISSYLDLKLGYTIVCMLFPLLAVRTHLECLESTLKARVALG